MVVYLNRFLICISIVLIMLGNPGFSRADVTGSVRGTWRDSPKPIVSGRHSEGGLLLVSVGRRGGGAPATAETIQQDRPVSGGLSAGNISVNGQRETANAFLVNGGDVSEGRNLGAGMVPNLDSIEEFRLITNSFDAEYGKFSGAVVHAITKSGTNGVHRDIFEFCRNDKLDANTPLTS